MAKYIYTTLIIFVFFVGCAGNQKNINQNVDGFKNVVDNAKVCVNTPKNGMYKNIVYFDSGRKVSEKIFMSLAKENFSVTIVNELEKCNLEEFDYIIVPKIIHWEDRATGWSGKPDIVKIKLNAYEPKFSENILEIKFEKESNLIKSGLIEWGNFSPEYLLDEDFTKTVLLLFSK